MREPVEPPRRVDARESLRRGQLSRRDRGEDRRPMLALHRVQRLRRAFDLRERRRPPRASRPADRLRALAERGFGGDRFGDRLRSSAWPACTIPRRADRPGRRLPDRAGRPRREPRSSARHDRARAACWSCDGAPRRSPAAPSSSDRKSRASASAAAAPRRPRPALPSVPRARRRPRPQSCSSASATTRRTASTATTGLTSAAGSSARSSGDSFDGQQPLDEAGEPLRRRQQHRDADDVVGGVVGGEQRHAVDGSARGAASAPR